jgi:hypothetical protein
MLEASVKEIVGTKVAFSGEFCQCHDILFVLDAVYDRFVEEMTKAIEALGEGRMRRLIHQNHYRRVKNMMESHTGESLPSPPSCDDTGLRIPVTMVVSPSEKDSIYQEEIFGPMWVVVSVPSIDVAIQRANNLPTGKPLTSYYYGQSSLNMDQWQAEVNSGCMAINAGPMRLQSNFNAAVHGVGNSGLGGASIWGRHVFETFSHKKHVVRPKDGAFAGSIWGARGYKPRLSAAAEEKIATATLDASVGHTASTQITRDASNLTVGTVHRFDFGPSLSVQRCATCRKACLNRGDEATGSRYCKLCFRQRIQ